MLIAIIKIKLKIKIELLDFNFVIRMNIILFTFIIVSIFILTLLKAKKSGIFESSEKVDTFKKLKIRVYKIKKPKNKKSINYNLTTSERKII